MTTTTQILSAVTAEGRQGYSLPERLCRDCAAALPIDGVGLALMNDAGHQGVIAATDQRAKAMEDLQFVMGEGPCLDASSRRQPVLQPDLAGSAIGRWPGYGPAVMEAGIAAVFAFPLQVGAIRLGILDLYRETPGDLNAEQLADALVYADAAVEILLHLQGQVEPGQGLHPQLGEPLQNRAEVHQATGVISVQAACGLTEALLLLQAHAYAADRSILLIARDVLAGTLRFPLGDDDHD